MSEPNKKPAAWAVLARDLRERALRAEQEGEPLALLEEAADEIDRLAAEAERLRMTDKERDAMEFFADLPWAKESGNAVEAEALRGFLDRHARETVGG
jgi:hypothetical protein